MLQQCLSSEQLYADAYGHGGAAVTTLRSSLNMYVFFVYNKIFFFLLLVNS
jgi:hypothetical protein